MIINNFKAKFWFNFRKLFNLYWKDRILLISLLLIWRPLHKHPVNIFIGHILRSKKLIRRGLCFNGYFFIAAKTPDPLGQLCRIFNFWKWPKHLFFFKNSFQNHESIFKTRTNDHWRWQFERILEWKFRPNICLMEFELWKRSLGSFLVILWSTFFEFPGFFKFLFIIRVFVWVLESKICFWKDQFLWKIIDYSVFLIKTWLYDSFQVVDLSRNHFFKSKCYLSIQFLISYNFIIQ